MSELDAALEAAPARTPEPELRVVGVRAEPFAAVPTLAFSLEVDEPSGREVYTIALSASIHIDPSGRGYDEATRDGLLDLFGEPGAMAGSLHDLPWARVDVLAPSFVGSGTFELPVPCTADLEVASAKYFASLHDGVAPLDFHFNGTIFYRGAGGALQLAQVPWSCRARFRLPVSAWRETVGARFANGGWVRISGDTLAGLRRRKAERGLPTFDALLAQLLEEGTE